jgi:hypothetical protein
VRERPYLPLETGPNLEFTKAMTRIGGMIREPVRLPQELVRRWPWASFERKLRWDAVDRPGYAYGAYQAGREARALGMSRISAIQLGVAGGNGLLALEGHAAAIERLLGVGVDVIGFDLGSGMPEPRDYRDMPYVWKAGYFQMDVDRLRSRATRAEIILGDVAETLPEFLDRPGVHPIGFVAVDLDYYSSTVAALSTLAAHSNLLLPRTFFYFDDVMGDDSELHSEYTGELLAIAEFNAAHRDLKLARINGLRYKRMLDAEWHAKEYVLHCFTHPLYERHIGRSDWQVPIA